MEPTDTRLLPRSQFLTSVGNYFDRAAKLTTHAAGLLDPGQTVVCTVTGNGLKDPEWAIAGAPTPVSVPVDAHAAAVELGLDG